jgi:hypothetical protein
MSTPELVKIHENRCDHLRWKGLFVDTEDEAGREHHPPDRIFWCLKTQQCVGPDGSIVGARQCAPTRDCFRPF